MARTRTPAVADASRELRPPWERRDRVAAVVVLGLALVALLVPLGRAGVLAPFELEAADLARRVAVHHLGSGWLAVADDPVAPPTLGDLGMGELPFTAMALAFRVLGLHAWAGRLPFALLAAVGVAAVWALVARFARPRAAAFAVVVLVTCPLFALQARTMLGDGATIACFAAAWAGLAGASLEGRSRAAALWLSLGAAGLVGGYLCRGALLGVAAPLLAAGLGCLVAIPLHPLGERRPRRVVAGVALLLGVAAVGDFLLSSAWIAAARGPEVLRAAGMSLQGAPAGEATFDRVIRQIGHAAFPWSAMAPFAFGRLLVPPSARRPSAADPGLRRSGTSTAAALRVHVLAALVVSFTCTTAVAPWTGDLPWAGVPALAVAIALALDDVAEGVPAGPIAALVALLVGAVLTADLVRDPERVLAALSVDDVAFPPKLVQPTARWVGATSLAVLLPLGVALALRPEQPAVRERLRGMIASARELLAAWQGWLAFLLVVIEAALVGLAAMVLVGRWLDWDTVVRLSRPTTRAFLHAWWVLPLACAAIPLAVAALGAILAHAAGRLGARPATVAVTVAGAVALAYSVELHGRVAAAMSPKEALVAYEARRGPDEPLGLVDLSAKLALFHGGGDVRSFEQPTDAFTWLVEGPATPRRWLVVPGRDLARLNALHRERSGQNVPVADASGEALLVVSDLRGAPDRNPLADVVLDAPRTPSRPVAATFDDALELVGWEVLDGDGAEVSEVSARTAYRARFFVRSIAPLPPSYRPFLHVERGKQRWNGDDAFVDRGYPSTLWQRGDVVVLECALQLDANFGPGDFDVFFGFFSGGERLIVVDGPASGDRVRLGVLRVR